MTENQTDLHPTKEKQGERTGVVNAPVHPTNARSAGISKGL